MMMGSSFQINRAFDHLTVMQHHTGPVLFIEEDHYLVDDFIPVLRQMVKLSHEYEHLPILFIYLSYVCSLLRLAQNVCL